MGAPLALTYQDIESFGRQMRLNLTPLQVDLIAEIDDVYLAVHYTVQSVKSKSDKSQGTADAPKKPRAPRRKN